MRFFALLAAQKIQPAVCPEENHDNQKQKTKNHKRYEYRLHPMASPNEAIQTLRRENGD
jgi:hypothetical protein